MLASDINTLGAFLLGVSPNIPPGGAGSGTETGVSIPVHLNRSSSSARAEYLSPADMTGAAEAAGAGGPVLAFRIGGRVTELTAAAVAGGGG